MSESHAADGVPRADGSPLRPLDVGAEEDGADVDQQLAPDTAAEIGTGGVRVVYTDTLPEGVFVVYRGEPPRLLVNEAWWQHARPVERIQALESLWARLQSVPPDAWDSVEQG